MSAHEVDDALHALLFEAVADVDEDDPGHQVGTGGGQRDGGDAAEGRAHDDGRGDAEVLVQGRKGGRQSVAADPWSRLRFAPARSGLRVVDGVGVAVAGEVGGEDVVPAGQGRPQLLVHVRRLPASVEAQDVGPPHLSPLEVVHLAIFDDGEPAATAGGDVVARNSSVAGAGAQRLSSHETLPE